MMDNDLIDLISAWCGSELSPSRCDELIARLEQDGEFQQAFVDEIRMLGMLKAVQSTEPRWLALHEELGWGGEWTHPTDEESENAIIRGLEGRSPRRFTRVAVWGGVAVLANIAVAVLAFIVWTKWGLVGWGSLDRSLAAARGSGLAVLTKLDSVEWGTPDGKGPSEGHLLASGRFCIRSGRALLVFLNGVTLTLDGPTDIDLLSIDRVFCREGRLRVRVPKGVEGFVVANRESAVVDLGTEFAMNVGPDGKSRIMVFEGAAEASLLDAKGFPRQTQRVEQSKQFEVDPGSASIAEAAAQPEQFIPSQDWGLPPLRLDAAYPSAVLKSRPLSYWRFESVTGEHIPNEVPDGPTLRVNGPVRIAREPGTNGHAIFKALASEQFLTTDATWQLTRGSRHAVEFWFLPETISYATLVALYPAVENLPKTLLRTHMLSVETIAHTTLSLEKPVSVRFLRRWLRDVTLSAEDHSVFSHGIYVPGRWHHVVAQRNGRRMELFFDGVREYATTAEADPPGIFYHLVVGRRTADPTLEEDRRPFVGRLDELAVYDHPLSPEEIQEHFRLGLSRSRDQ
jgi:hypothetical protein